MRGNKLLVGGFIIATFVIWLAFDAWLGPNGGPTESQVIAYWGRHLTFWSYLLGALNGHWLLGRKSANYSLGYIPFIGLVLLLGWDIYFINHYGWVETWIRSPWLWFFAGLPVGSLFWPQKDEDSFVP